jgi:hypothetical protein
MKTVDWKQPLLGLAALTAVVGSAHANWPLAFLGLALIVESFAEYVFGMPFDKVRRLRRYRWTLRYFAMALGVLVAAGYGLDFMPPLLGVTPQPVGILLTGLMIGRGSNFAHEVLAAFGGGR